jgi:hypothetical protein
MLRVVFDTNIYGKLAIEDDIDKIGKLIAEDSRFIVYGFQPIRKELRQIPKYLKLGNVNQRCFSLTVYDLLTKNKQVKETQKMKDLAKKIYQTYRQKGGIKNWEKTNIDKDFLIMACAMIKEIDVIVSDNLKTLFSIPAKQAYEQVAPKQQLKIPRFWTYSELREKYDF